MVKRCGFLALRFQCLVDILSFLLKLKVLKEYGSETTGIFVMSMTDYINGFWPDLNEAKDLLESLSSINDVEELNIGRSDIAVSVGASICKEFHEYFPNQVLEAGIKSVSL